MSIRCPASLFCLSAPRYPSLTFCSTRFHQSGDAARPLVSRRLAAHAVAVMFIMGFASFSHGQGTLTTSDGMTLSLSSTGAVSTLKSGSTNYGSGLPSGFFVRELAATTSNLVSNGSFESGSSTPTSWTISGGTGGNWSFDSTTSTAGARSMKVAIAGSTALRSPDLKSNSISIHPNTPYSLFYSLKTSGLSYALAVQLFEVDSLGNLTKHELANPTGTNPWTSYQLTFVSGADAASAYCIAFIYKGYGYAWLDDVQLTDVFGGNQPISFTGSVTSSSGVLTQTASHNNLNLSATFTSVGSAIKVSATLTDTTGTDRALELSYQLPLNVPGWTWDQDFLTPITIAANTRYQYVDSQFDKAQSHSIYPFATVRNGSAAFSLAVPMGPQLDRLSYDTGDGLRVSWDLGLSAAATKTRSKATVSFWIYTANPAWGMRAAAAKYYALNPASFTAVSAVRGSWVLQNNLSLTTVPNPQDFGWGFHEGDGELAFDDAHGFLGLHYIDSDGWFRLFPGYINQPSYSTIISTLSNDACCGAGYTVDSTPVTEMATAVINSSPYNAAGLYEVTDDPYFWYNGREQVYPVSPEPDIPAPSMYSVIKKYRVDNRISLAQSQGNTLGGFFLDDLTGLFPSLENYRRPHWAYSDLPLSFSYVSRKVVLYNGFSMGEYIQNLANYVHPNGYVILGNGSPGSCVWFANYQDVVGGEYPDGPESMDRAIARRTFAYGKAFTNLFVNRQNNNPATAAQVLAYLRQALLLGYFPGFNGLYWDNPTAYERDRPVFQQYIPLLQTEAAAGWQPVTYVTSSVSNILVERFGSPNTFYFSAQNTGASTSSPTFTIDGAGLGISATATVTAKELLSNQSLAVARSGNILTISDSLTAGKTSLYKVTATTATPPTVSSSSPSIGPTAGGTDVTISGTGFQTSLSVLIGGVSASVTSVSSTSINAKTGPHSSGSVDIKVTNPGGLAGSLPNGYTYQDTSGSTGLDFHVLTPCRILDTRKAPGPMGGPALIAKSQRNFAVTGTCGIPSDARALSVNVTVTLPTAIGDLRLFAGDTPAPGTWAINYGSAQTRANVAIVALGSAGDLSVYCDQSSGTVQMILDVNGFFR
jgi:IPT/TIG domain